MKPGTHHSPMTQWPSRPFKIRYSLDAGPKHSGLVKVGPIVSCSSPEAVIRSAALRIISNRADVASVWLDGSEFAGMFRTPDGTIAFTVY